MVAAFLKIFVTNNINRPKFALNKLQDIWKNVPFIDEIKVEMSDHNAL